MKNQKFTMFKFIELQHCKDIGFYGFSIHKDKTHILGGRNSDEDCLDHNHNVDVPPGLPANFTDSNNIVRTLTDTHPNYDLDQARFISEHSSWSNFIDLTKSGSERNA